MIPINILLHLRVIYKTSHDLITQKDVDFKNLKNGAFVLFKSFFVRVVYGGYKLNQHRVHHFTD